MNRIIIHRPGELREIIQRDAPPSLDEMQKLVGEGVNVTVELIPGPGWYDGNPAQLFVDEEGLHKPHLKENGIATGIVLAQPRRVLLAGPIRGNLVVLQGKAMWT